MLDGIVDFYRIFGIVSIFMATIFLEHALLAGSRRLNSLSHHNVGGLEYSI